MSPQAAGRGNGFVPWSVPAAGGMVLGVACSGGVAAGTGVALALTAAVAAALLAARGRAAHWRASAAMALVAFAVGAIRHELWEARPDPVRPYLEQETRWVGSYDGEWFSATEPVATRLALVSREPLQPGALRLTGTARRAPGKRNPGGFDYAAYLARRGVSAQLFVANVLEARPRSGARQRLARGVAAGLPAEVAGLQLAMTLGLRDDLTSEDRDAFRRSGLAHVLALSGLHFGVLLAAAGRALKPLGRRRRPVLLALIVGFVVLVGPTPSVVRAAAMALASLLALTSGVGRLEAWPVLALSACVSLLLQPQMLFDLSFQLSYMALLGLLAFSGPIARALGVRDAVTDPLRPDLPGAGTRGARGRLRRYGALALGASIAAQLPSLSLVAGTFGSVPAFSPLVNLIGVPLSALLVPLGFLAGLVGLAWEPLAAGVNAIVLPIARGLIALADLGARLPVIGWPHVEWLGHLCWAAFVVALWLAARRRLRPSRVLLVTLVAAVVPTAAGSARPPPDVWFLDVGQGDATLIRLRGGYDVLIDGGGTPFSDFDVGERVVLPALRALGVRDLDAVIATHPDADHVEGLLSLLRDVPVGTLVTGPPTPTIPLDTRVRDLAAELGLDVHVAVRGETLVLGRSGEARLEILHPPAGPPEEPGNEASVVTLLRYRGQPVLLAMADAGMVTEDELALGRIHTLKVGHHGSRYSTSDELLVATRPSLAVISVGENRYGHPHPTVLARLREHGVPVITTLSSGAVRLALKVTP
ncbi:MAG TPA: DNA internalization-related competence protein ComEC/Rec2 [Trueperaceae bacterium]